MNDDKAVKTSVAKNKNVFPPKKAAKMTASMCHLRTKDIMVPLSAFANKIYEDQTAAEAVEAILFFMHNPTGSPGSQESLHRSILVVDEHEMVIGVLNFCDLLKSLCRPSLRLLPKEEAPSGFGRQKVFGPLGDFATMVREKATRIVRELLPHEIPMIDENAYLMDALEKMFSLKVNSILVIQDNEPVGVIRQKDLFLEMARILSEQGWERKQGN